MIYFTNGTSFCSVLDNLVGPAPMGLLTPSAVGSKLRRPSALPTPVNRRISGIPALTPKSVSRLGKPIKNALLPSALDQGATHLRFLFIFLHLLSIANCSPIVYNNVIGHYLYSPGNMKTENQDYKEAPESTEETCPPPDLQPFSLVFNLEDETEELLACEPAVVENSSEPSTCDPEPSSCDPEPSHISMEPPTLPDTKDIKDGHQQITDKQGVKEVNKSNLSKT